MPRHSAVATALALLVAGATLSACSTTQGGFGDEMGLSPHARWKALETPHFRLTYPEELGEVAAKAAGYFEEAHALLSPRLLWEPKDRVSVILVDNTDSMNGLASPSRRFGILLMTTPPENWQSIYYYDDWLRFVVIHEYTHILNLDATSGLYSVARVVFGDVTLPNMVWPNWMTEGLAVYMETRFTRSGRGRSPYWEMILRAAEEQGVLNTHRFMTLDRIQGDSPYFPFGETRYLFGYQLMNQVAATGGDLALGELSRDSSGGLPYQLNTRLQRAVRKDWYETWDDWLGATRARTRKQLETIRQRPVTGYRLLTQEGTSTLGSALSPDGKWLAFSQESAHERMQLRLLDRQSGEIRTLTRKSGGARLAFTPDSHWIVYGSSHRDGGYTEFSELFGYDLQSRRVRQLTDGLRARDPDVSRDGNWIVFTRAAHAKTELALASLERPKAEDGELKLGPTRTLYSPATFDAVHSPRFSADGKSVIFTAHRNGHVSEELLQLELATGKVTELVADGKFNRFPSVAADGSIYFVSDRSGVDNVYRYEARTRAARPVTNLTTGAAFPTATADGKLYASVFSFTGWDLAELATDPALLQGLPPISPPPAPAPLEGMERRAPSSPTATPGNAQDYRALPSLLMPRNWSPSITIYGNQGAILGAQFGGVDTLDLHRYGVGVYYDTGTKLGDWALSYENRTLGPTVGFYAANETDSATFLRDGTLRSYDRRASGYVSLFYPVQWTYSTLTPSLSLNAERSATYSNLGSGAFSGNLTSPIVPSVDAELLYSNTDSSNLAVTAESGHSLRAGTRLYLGLDQPVWKFLVKGTEYIRLTEHSVLVPSLKGSWTTYRSPRYAPTDVRVRGRYLDRLSESFSGDSLSRLSIRGYPGAVYLWEAAAAAALDYRFPLLRVYRGLGTHPAFLEELFGFTFAEATHFPGTSVTLPSAGAGLRMSGHVLVVMPLVLSLEYHQGFNREYGGRGEFFFQMGGGNFSF